MDMEQVEKWRDANLGSFKICKYIIVLFKDKLNNVLLENEAMISLTVRSEFRSHVRDLPFST